MGLEGSGLTFGQSVALAIIENVCLLGIVGAGSLFLNRGLERFKRHQATEREIVRDRYRAIVRVFASLSRFHVATTTLMNAQTDLLDAATDEERVAIQKTIDRSMATALRQMQRSRRVLESNAFLLPLELRRIARVYAHTIHAVGAEALRGPVDDAVRAELNAANLRVVTLLDSILPALPWGADAAEAARRDVQKRLAAIRAAITRPSQDDAALAKITAVADR